MRAGSKDRSQDATQSVADPTHDRPTPPMEAVVQHRYGSPDVLERVTIDRPTIAANEVLIEVHVAGIDRGTWHLMTGRPYLIRIAGFGLSRPKRKVLGLDVAGRVITIGADVTRFAEGDEVFGMASGSFAQYAAASEECLAHKPRNVSFRQAGVAAVSGITALQALTDVGNLQSGQQVLIIGASGGVGTFSVQLAKAMGGEVTAVAGTRNLDLVRDLGADRVIDYSREDFASGDGKYDLILDIGGRSGLRRLQTVLKTRGTLVIVGGEGGNRWTGGVGRQLRAILISLFVKKRLTAFISKANFASVERLADYMRSGAVVAAIGQEFDLDGVPEAIRRMHAGQTSGKSVVIVRGTASDR